MGSGECRIAGVNVSSVGERTRTLFGDYTILFQITFVGDHDDREVVLVLDAQNLLLEGHDFFEGLT